MQAARLGERMHPLPPAEASRKQAVEVAQQFEELFTRNMVATMREGAQMTGEDGGMFGSGPGADTYADWFDQHLSKHLTKNGRFGIAEVIIRDLERHREIEPLPKAEQIERFTCPPREAKGGIDVAA